MHANTGAPRRSRHSQECKHPWQRCFLCLVTLAFEKKHTYTQTDKCRWKSYPHVYGLCGWWRTKKMQLQGIHRTNVLAISLPPLTSQVTGRLGELCWWCLSDIIACTWCVTFCFSTSHIPQFKLHSLKEEERLNRNIIIARWSWIYTLTRPERDRFTRRPVWLTYWTVWKSQTTLSSRKHSRLAAWIHDKNALAKLWAADRKCKAVDDSRLRPNAYEWKLRKPFVGTRMA